MSTIKEEKTTTTTTTETENIPFINESTPIVTVSSSVPNVGQGLQSNISQDQSGGQIEETVSEENIVMPDGSSKTVRKVVTKNASGDDQTEIVADPEVKMLMEKKRREAGSL